MKQRDYPENLFGFLYKIEPKHFWFIGRNEIISNFIKNFTIEKKSLKFIEIGCGTGFTLSYIEKHLGFSVTGIDISKDALRYAKKRTKGSLICAEIDHKYHGDRSFDLLGLFDVIEHVGNPNDFLRNCSKFIKKAGHIIITVPSDMSLWSYIDEISGHKKRYNMQDLTTLLINNHFRIIRMNYFGFFLYYPLLLTRKYLNKKLTLSNDQEALMILKKSLVPPTYILNYIFELLMKTESIFINKLTFPFGTSMIVYAQKL